MQKIIVICAVLLALGYLLQKFYAAFFAKKQKCSSCSFNNALTKSEEK